MPASAQKPAKAGPKPGSAGKGPGSGEVPELDRAEQFERLRLAAPSLKVARPSAAPGAVPGALRIPKEWLTKMQKGK